VKCLIYHAMASCALQCELSRDASSHRQTARVKNLLPTLYLVEGEQVVEEVEVEVEEEVVEVFPLLDRQGSMLSYSHPLKCALLQSQQGH